MRTVSLRNLRAHKVRLGLTIVAVLLGTAFVAGSLVFTDTLKHSFDNIFANSDKGIDAQVQARDGYGAGVPVSLVPRIASVDGVGAIEPQISGSVVVVDSHGHKVSTGGAPSEGGNWTTRDGVQTPPTLVKGHAPRATGEIVVNDTAAAEHHLAVGDTVKLVTDHAGVAPMRIVGLYRLSFDTGGYLGALMSRNQAMALFADGSHVTAVAVAAKAGVSQATVAARLQRILPADLVAKTGKQVRDDDSDGVSSALGFVTYLLFGFGIVALLVGTFIIYNTFSMIVAQRQRELALLRAIGADRRQVRRSVVGEAAVIGVLGSVLGLTGGVGLAYGLHALLDAFGTGLPAGGLVLSVRTVIVSIAVGTVVTVLAATGPARRAGRIAPVAAMRAEFASQSAASLRRRTALGVVVLAAAVTATVFGFRAGKTGDEASLTGLGLLGVVVATMLLSPVLARAVIAPLGRLLGFGTVGRLARTNALRNPRRTAATGFALTLGLVLVTGIAVVGASMKASLNHVIDNNVKADYILTTSSDVNVPLRAADAVRHLPGVGSITELHDLETRIDGKKDSGYAIDGALAPVFDIDMLHGSATTDSRHLIVSKQQASTKHWTIGTHVTFSVPGRAPVTLTVGGIYADSPLLSTWLVSGDVYRALTPSSRRSDNPVLVHAAPGTDLATLRTELERATDKYYVVDIEDRTQFKGHIASQINGLLGLLYGLLGLAIVIAVLGIINTQALSVVERRRELGMLRAVGMQRRQVRRTVYLESFYIAVFGALLGVGVGLGYGALFARTLRSEGLGTLSVPWAQAGLFLVLAGVVGVLAAVWPGFRAARTPALRAVATQ